MRTVDINDIILIVVSVTGNTKAGNSMQSSTPLLGAMPEVDSMGIINIILALEKRFGFQIDDEEIEQSVFESVGSLHDFVQSKLDNMPGSAASAG